MHVCKFLIRKTIRNHFLEIFCKLQSTFKKFDNEFVFSNAQTLYCKPHFLIKGDFSKFLEGLLFGTYHALLRFLDRVAKPWSSCYFIKKWFHHRRSPTNFKILETNKGNICSRMSFRIVISEWIGQLQFFKKGTTKDVFLIIFQSFLNSSFSSSPWRISLEAFS